MLDFETLYRTRGEHYIYDILSLWERSSRIKHPCEMDLEDRWNYFLSVTDPCISAAVYSQTK
ncbi:MAG: hypothetical protein AB7S81_04355 [Bdellovibrionales bacterium]